MTAVNPRRRAADRAPLTNRLALSYWRAVDRLEREAVNIVGFCALGVFGAFCAAVVFYGASR
jgi:hypothetical protein